MKKKKIITPFSTYFSESDIIIVVQSKNWDNDARIEESREEIAGESTGS